MNQPLDLSDLSNAGQHLQAAGYDQAMVPSPSQRSSLAEGWVAVRERLGPVSAPGLDLRGAGFWRGAFAMMLYLTGWCIYAMGVLTMWFGAFLRYSAESLVGKRQ